MYTTLTTNIVDTVEALTPTEGEVAARALVVREVGAAVRAALPEFRHIQVLPFGSSVSGLGTRGSDIDMVVVGARAPRSVDKGFYDRDERPGVARLLDKIVSGLRAYPSLRLHKVLVIRHARIPLAKVEVEVVGPRGGRAHTGEGAPVSTSVDISITTDAGPRAAAYMAGVAAQHRALRPLVLVAKAYLKVCDLNEVASGGLSSFGLAYMVLAHLMEEARAGGDTEDLGLMAHRLFRRFSPGTYDTGRMLVAPGQGGVVPRAHMGSRYYSNLDRICVVDPLTGRDVTEGAYRSGEVMGAMGRAARYLDGVASAHAASCAPDLDILGGLVQDVDAADDDDDEEEDDRYARRGAGRSFDADAARRHDRGDDGVLALAGDEW